MSERLSEGNIRQHLDDGEKGWHGINAGTKAALCREVLDLRRKLGWHGGEMPEDEMRIPCDSEIGNESVCPRCGRYLYVPIELTSRPCPYCDRALRRYFLNDTGGKGPSNYFDLSSTPARKDER